MECIVMKELNINWKSDFIEYQTLLYSSVDPEWFYACIRNDVLVPAYTGQGKQYFWTKDILEAHKIIPIF